MLLIPTLSILQTNRIVLSSKSLQHKSKGCGQSIFVFDIIESLHLQKLQPTQKTVKQRKSHK